MISKMAVTTEQNNPRKPEFPIEDLFYRRWSPRAMSGKPLTKEELMPLFEAAKWAPSSFNNQPWRFIYALKNTPQWNNLFDLLVDFNKSWAKNAGVLILIISKKTSSEGKKIKTHSFDTGASWMNLALQGHLLGYVVHGIEGFDYEKARKVLEIPDEYEIEAMAAVGKPGQKESLPEAMQEKEKPNQRRDLAETIFEGKFRQEVL